MSTIKHICKSKINDLENIIKIKYINIYINILLYKIYIFMIL